MNRYKGNMAPRRPANDRLEHVGYYYDEEDNEAAGFGLLLGMGLLIIAFVAGFIAITAEPASKAAPFAWTQLYTGRDLAQPKFDVKGTALGTTFKTIQNLNPNLIVSTDLLGEKRLLALRPNQQSQTKIWFMNQVVEQKRKSYRIRHEQVFNQFTLVEIQDRLKDTFGKPTSSACKKSHNSDMKYCSMTWLIAKKIDLNVTLRVSTAYKQKPTIRMVADGTHALLMAERDRDLELDVMPANGPEDKKKTVSEETLPF